MRGGGRAPGIAPGPGPAGIGTLDPVGVRRPTEPGEVIVFVELVSVEDGKPFLLRAEAVESVHPLKGDRSIVVSTVTQRLEKTTEPRKYVVKGDYEATKKLFLGR